MAHELDGEKRSAGLNSGFAPPGCAGGTHCVVTVLSGSDNGAVPYSTGNLPGQPARSRHRGDVSACRNGAHVNGAVRVFCRCFRPFQPVVLGVQTCLPGQPVFTALFRKQVFAA